MVSFELSDEQRMVQETVASFAVDQIEPLAHESEESGSVPEDVIAKGWELGLVGGCIPEEYDGFGEGLSALTNVIATEEMAAGDLAIALHLMSPTMLAYSVLDQGTEEQKKEFLPNYCGEGFKPASCALVEPKFDFCASTLFTTAEQEYGEYVINGKKCLAALAAESDFVLVFAATSPGMGFAGVDAFILPRDSKGMEIGEREKNMGVNALATYPVTFKDCRVPVSARLGGEAGSDYLRLLSRSRIALAALAVGMSKRAVAHSRDYARDRVAFGEPIGSRQAIAFMLAEMAIEVDASRMLAWEAAWLCDKGLDFFREASMAKNYAADAAMMVGDRSVQIMGGHGYIRENPVELWFRNARGFATFEGMAMV
jgi:acyl-CoA dehydrogenase